MTQQAVRLALVNDYEVVVAGLASLLQTYTDRVEVVELDVLDTPHRPVDIAIYDTFAAPNGQTTKISDLLGNEQVSKVVVYSFNEDPNAARDTMAMGASGYVSKAVPVSQFVDALERIHRGESEVMVLTSPVRTEPMVAWPGQEEGLTCRESEILALITQGLSNSEITTKCYLSINTVKTYVRSAYRKIGVSTRAQAVAWAMRHGFDTHQMSS